MQPDLLLCFVKEIGVDLGANMINRDVNTNCESIWSSDGDSFFILLYIHHILYIFILYGLYIIYLKNNRTTL